MEPTRPWYAPADIGQIICNADGSVMCDADGNILCAALRDFIRIYTVDWKQLRESEFEDWYSIHFEGGQKRIMFGIAVSVNGSSRVRYNPRGGGEPAHGRLEQYEIPGDFAGARVDVYGYGETTNTTSWGKPTIIFTVVDQLGNAYRKKKTFAPGKLDVITYAVPAVEDYKHMLTIIFAEDGTVASIV